MPDTTYFFALSIVWVKGIVLFLHPEEQEVVDGLADELGMSRSELVSHLFELELARGDEGGGPVPV